MRITYSVTKGIHKVCCEDTARIGDAILNDTMGELELTTPATIALCDGVGGNAGGQEASGFVCTNLCKELQELNSRLIAYGKQLGKPTMATTITALFFEENGNTLVHAGNTRLYAYRGGFLNQITTDQTTYEWLKSIGNTEGAEACNRSEIRCAMGGGNPDYLKSLVMERVFERKVPKLLMLTTDGVHDYMSQDEIEEILAEEGSMGDKIGKIVELAAAHGSEDDRSVIVIEA